MAEFTSLNGYQVKDTIARSIAKGRNQAVAFVDYETMIEALNGLEKDEYRSGQNIYIGVVGVPDLWVYGIEDIVHNFEYVSDEDIVEMLKNNTTIQVGYYKLAMLEGQKVDLTTYDQHLIKHDDDITALDGKITEGLNEVNDSLGGCTLEQEGEDFFIVGADSVRKKLGSGVDDFGEFSTNSASAYSFVTEIGKHYIVSETRFSNTYRDPLVTINGATIIKQSGISSTAGENGYGAYLKSALIQATSTTVTITGSYASSRCQTVIQVD